MVHGGGGNSGLVLTFAVVFLLGKARENRDKHSKAFETARTQYAEALIEVLEKKLAAARAGKPVLHQINLTTPFNNLTEYDRAIEMLEACVDKEIQIDQKLFKQLVQDQWEWKEEFDNVGTNYSNKLWRRAFDAEAV